MVIFKRTITVGAILFLTGCTPLLGSQQHTQYVNVCPVLIHYTKKQQQELLTELNKLPKNSIIWTFIKGYSTLRQETRDCLKGQ